MERYIDICEEELKNRVRVDLFKKYDCAKIIGKIDFTVRVQHYGQGSIFDDYLLWAETKKDPSDIYDMLTQLILTIAKDEKLLYKEPPAFLGCFDCEKITFIKYEDVIDVLHGYVIKHLDLKKITPADHRAKAFKEACRKVKSCLQNKIIPFDFEQEEHELREFIKDNFVPGRTETNKIKITMRNFISTYYLWQDTVKPTIQVLDWDKLKKDRIGVLDCDFYLADLLSEENRSFKKKLSVLLEQNYYKVTRRIEEMERFIQEIKFSDNQATHTQFWNKYERPPAEIYWDEMVNRHDLLVPRDIRERKGSYYTPEIWVKLSQEYIAGVFGKDWQDKYYIWDCAAGTGNLLAGLTNKYNIWASTLDQPDVDIMHDRIDNGMNLLKDHCFQFDFLNDEFKNLPEKLQKIIKTTPEKLIVYINPPYGENTNYGEKSKPGLSKSNVYDNYKDSIGGGFNEVFAQFLIRIYNEIKCCKIASFAKLKALCASNFVGFRKTFQADLVKLFVAPSYTFDNVPGRFPIGFHIWDANKKTTHKQIIADVYDENGNFTGTKKIFPIKKGDLINDWYRQFYDNDGVQLGILHNIGNDFQQKKGVFISTDNNFNHTSIITSKNILYAVIYIAVRHCIEPTWLNDRDQFLYPNKKWEKDIEFQNDCLAFALFHDSNNISSAHGVNHWIPFTEKEIDAKDKFDSHFMLSFMTGKIIQNGYSNLFEHVEDRPCIKRVFSAEAKAVFHAGRKLWTYYHAQKKVNVNASFYDIREHFQGRDSKGRMNNKSEDAKYNELIGELREKMKVLAKKIEPKIYEYGFLRE